MSVMKRCDLMLENEHVSVSCRFIGEIYDLFITKLITYHVLFSNKDLKTKKHLESKTKIQDCIIPSTSKLVKCTQERLRSVVSDLAKPKESFDLDDIEPWLNKAFVNIRKNPPVQTTIIESAHLLFCYLISRGLDLSKTDEYANKMLQYFVNPVKEPIYKGETIAFHIISNNSASTIQYSFQNLTKLFGTPTTDEKASDDTKITLSEVQRYSRAKGFVKHLEQVKVMFIERDFDEAGMNTKIDAAKNQVDTELAKFEEIYNFEHINDIIRTIGNMKKIMKNEKPEKEETNEGTSSGNCNKNTSNSISRNGYIDNITFHNDMH